MSFVDNVSLVGPQKSVNEAISDEIPSMKETFSQESLAENKYNDRDTVTSSENATIHNLSDLISTIPDEKQSSDINTDDVSHTISTLPMITTEDADSAPRDLLLSTIEEYELSAETTQKGISPSSTVEAERDTSMLYNDAEMIGKLEDDLAKNPKEHNITLSTVLDSVTSRSSIDRNLSSDLPDVSSSDMNSRLPKALYVDAHGFDESAALAEEIDHKKGENEEYIADANTSPAIAISHIESHQELSESASKEIGIRPSSFIDDQITTESKNVLVDGKQAGPGEATYTSASVEVPVVRLSEEEIKRNSALEAAIFLHNRGLSLYNNGYFQKALPLFEECLAVRGDYIPTDSLTASTIVDIGKNYVALSSWDLAEDFFAKALAIRQNSSNEEEIAKIYYEWAKCFYIQGLLFDSLDRINLAIKTLSQFLKGETNSLYGECLILQALVTVGLGKVVEAKAMADRGHAIVNKFNGANHMTGADAMTVKAQIMCVIGRAKEAISLIEQGFVLRKRLLERESHPILADSLLLMGSAFFDIGRFVDAENKLNAAYLMRVEYFGDKDIRAAEVQHFQGNLHQALGNFDLAISLHKTALAIRSAQCHPQKRLIFLSDSHNSLAEVYTNCGIFKEAIFHYNEALEIRSERLTDPALIAGLKEQKLKQEAGEVLQELLEVPPDHMKVAESKCGKAELLRLLGSYIEARELIDQSLQGRRAVFGKEHMSFIESQFVFGNILMDTGDFDNANRYHSRSIKIVRQLLGEEHHLYAKALLCKAENLRRKALQRADDSRTNTTGEDGDQENKMSDPLSNANSLVVEALQSLKYAFDGVGRKVPLQIIGEILETSVALTRRILESRKNKLIQSINTVPESVENNTIGENLDICTETNKKEVSFDREKYSNIVHSLERLFLDVIKVFPMVGKNHYLALFIIGTVGVAKLFEFDDRQRYYSSLSHENKKAFREQDLLSLSKVNDQLVDWLEILGITKSPSVQHESNDSEENDQPPGLKEINVVIKKLRSPKFVGLSEMHPWIRFLQEVASNFEYVPDEMELAALAFQKAEKLHKQGKFPEADLLYDNAFVTQINFLGPVAASTSVAIAETLIAKAENCRVQGLLDLAKLLFTQSMSILRKNSGDANPLVTVAMFGNANVLFDRGLYDDALALHITVFNMQNKHFGERSVQVNKTLIRIAYDQFKLGRCMEAFEIVQGALKNLLQVKEEVHQAHGDEDAADFGGAYLCLAYITLALGKFQDCKNYVDVAYSVRKVSALAIGISNYDDHYRVLEVLICRAQYLLTIGRIFESHKLVDMLMKAQIKLFCRSSVVVNRLSDQSIAFVNNFDSFADVSHTDSELLKQEANRPKKVNEIEEDYDLQKEIDAADSNLASSIGDTTNSVVSVAMLYAGNVSVFNYKGLPLSTHPALIDTFLIRARICMLMADLSQAKEMLTGSSAMIDALLPNRQSVLKLTISFEQGNLAQCRGCYEEAKNIHNSVMQQRLSICSEESADKGDSLFALGIANLSLSRLDDSTQIFSQSLEERMKCFGPDHWKLCEIFNGKFVVLLNNRSDRLLYFLSLC